MTTLIAYYTSDGCEGRCDAKCYNATGPDCECICGGANHGVGLRKAMDNTQKMAEEWIRRWIETHPGGKARVVPQQLSLFDLTEA